MAGRRRFKRTGLRDEQKAGIVEAIDVARGAIGPIMLNYYFETAEYQACRSASDALRKLAVVLTGNESIFMGQDFSYLCVRPEEEK